MSDYEDGVGDVSDDDMEAVTAAEVLKKLEEVWWNCFVYKSEVLTLSFYQVTVTSHSFNDIYVTTMYAVI